MYLQPKFEVPFSEWESKAFPAKVLNSTFDVVHSEVLELVVGGKSKDVNTVQVNHRLASVEVKGPIRE